MVNLQRRMLTHEELSAYLEEQQGRPQQLCWVAVVGGLLAAAVLLEPTPGASGSPSSAGGQGTTGSSACVVGGQQESTADALGQRSAEPCADLRLLLAVVHPTLDEAAEVCCALL